MWKRLLLGMIAVGGLAAPTWAADAYPTKPIRMVVPFAPGASSDAVARLVAERLKDVLGQSVIVENRAGAGGALGASLVAKAEPDGYTILMAPGAQALAKYVMKSPPFEASDFTPIANLVFVPYVIVGAKNQPFTSLNEMIAYAKAHPGELSIGNSEITTRLAAESLAQVANVQLTHVNYKGGGPIVNDAVGGHVALGVATPVSILGFYKDGRVQALAISSPRRLPILPDVPTVAEALKIPTFDSQTFFAMMAPAKTPKAAIDRLQKAVAQVMADPDVRKRLQEMGMDPATDTTSEGLASLMKNFAQQNGALIERAGIKAE